MENQVFVIFHKDSTLLIGKKEGYQSRRIAMQMRDRLCKDGNFDENAYDVADSKAFYETIEKKHVRHGVGPAHGNKFEVGVNTPWTSGPWSETYWSA